MDHIWAAILPQKKEFRLLCRSANNYFLRNVPFKVKLDYHHRYFHSDFKRLKLSLFCDNERTIIPKQVTHLDLSFNNNISEKDLPTKLISLLLAGNTKIVKLSPKKLPDLQELILNDNQTITLDHLNPLTRLTCLYINDNSQVNLQLLNSPVGHRLLKLGIQSNKLDYTSPTLLNHLKQLKNLTTIELLIDPKMLTKINFFQLKQLQHLIIHLNKNFRQMYDFNFTANNAAKQNTSDLKKQLFFSIYPIYLMIIPPNLTRLTIQKITYPRIVHFDASELKQMINELN